MLHQPLNKCVNSNQLINWAEEYKNSKIWIKTAGMGWLVQTKLRWRFK
ncbi:hypothetical protein SLEP1_g57769 [Rubroshorea leprosula]|uniref:Uncharacterized protein n=1 Tax=Rubroshorea leprosula TaxID=152421 RepID=A0AAV5MQH4_9ROSI|nr:hypothetical protein SLEP1_g57769 [Rubroshorea leprosula]